MRTVIRLISTGWLAATLFLSALEAVGQTQVEITQNNVSNVIFRDDFTGTSLHPGWYIKNEEASRWALTEGDYLFIITAPFSQNGPVNRFVYRGELPEDYSVTTKMDMELNYADFDSWNRAYVGIERDDENAVRLQLGGDGEVVFDKILNGERSRLVHEVGNPSGSVLLRITKRGVEFEGAYSFDGSTWSDIGPQFFINLNGQPVLSGYNTDAGVADTGIRVDYVDISAP